MGKGASILVIDDEEVVRMLISDSLEQDGYEVLSAGTLDLADELLDSRSIDLVVLDLYIGDESGLDFLAEVRENKNLDVPVIIITGYPARDAVRIAAKYGIRHFLLKPLDLARLTAAVENSLSAEGTEPEDDDIQFSFEGKKALIISGDNTEQSILTSLLDELDLLTVSAEDWLDGMKMIKDENPNVVFVSSALPDVDGIKMIRRLEEGTGEGIRTHVLIESEKRRTDPGGTYGLSIKLKSVTLQSLAAILSKMV